MQVSKSKWMVLAFIFLTCGCIGRSAPPECDPRPTSSLLSTKDFTLSKNGSQFTFADWTFSVEPGVLESDAKIICEDRTGSNLAVQVPHRFNAIETNQSVDIVHTHPPSNLITPIRCVAQETIRYSGQERIRATVNTQSLPADDITVMQSPTRLLQPDFASIPTSRAKSFIVEPVVASLVGEDSGWLYTLAHDLEQSQQCLLQAIDEIAKQIGDRVGDYVDDPCKACQAVTGVVVDVVKCKDFVNNITSILCEAFLAEAAKESWTATLLNYGCKGAAWLDVWGHAFVLQIATGQDPVEAICNNADNLKRFLDQYKIHSNCMCELFIRDPKCKESSTSDACKNIWSSVVGENPKP